MRVENVAKQGHLGTGSLIILAVVASASATTDDECMSLSMVGLPRKYLPLVESIYSGKTLIFLFIGREALPLLWESEALEELGGWAGLFLPQQWRGYEEACAARAYRTQDVSLERLPRAWPPW